MFSISLGYSQINSTVDNLISFNPIVTVIIAKEIYSEFPLPFQKTGIAKESQLSIDAMITIVIVTATFVDMIVIIIRTFVFFVTQKEPVLALALNLLNLEELELARHSKKSSKDLN